MSIGRNNTLQDENFEECFLIYVRPQGKKSTLWICFNAYRLSRDYEEKSVNKIFYDNDRRKACVKLAFRLRFIYSSYKIACQEQAGNPPVF